MTFRFVKNVCAVGVLAAVSAISAAAQASSLQVTVPFAFVVNGVKLNAGTYWVQKADETGLLLIHGRPGQSAAVLTNTTGDYAAKEEAPGLSFERNADGEPVLTKVQLAGEPSRSVTTHTAASPVKAIIAGK